MQNIIEQTDYNTRANDMWRPISQAVNFRKKRVIDLGCGYGDFTWRAHIAGAKWVKGIDEVELFVSSTKDIELMNIDINELVKGSVIILAQADICMCFSVLAYLNDIPATLQWMADNFKISLIEVRYEPEPFNTGISNDEQMLNLLLRHFEYAKPLGRTHVVDRDAYRTIWMCR